MTLHTSHRGSPASRRTFVNELELRSYLHGLMIPEDEIDRLVLLKSITLWPGKNKEVTFEIQ